MKMRRKVAVCWFALSSIVAVSPASAAHVEADRLTPSDAEMVVHVNVRQLLQTPVVKKHARAPIEVLLKHNDELQQLLSAAGIDPLKDIDTLNLSTSGNPLAKGKLLAVVRGDFDPDKARSAAEEWAKKHPGRIKSFKDGELPMWEITSDNKSMFAAFAGKNALVMTTTKEDTSAAVQRAGQAPQRPSKAMQTALEQIQVTQSLWMVLVATDDIKQMLQKDGNTKDFAAALQSVTGGLELTDDAQLLLVVHTNSPEAAAKVKSKLDELMTLVNFLGAGQDKTARIAKEVLENIKLKIEKNDVSIRLQISDARIEKARKNER
jgi:hypothetical protein